MRKRQILYAWAQIVHQTGKHKYSSAEWQISFEMFCRDMRSPTQPYIRFENIDHLLDDTITLNQTPIKNSETLEKMKKKVNTNDILKSEEDLVPLAALRKRLKLETNGKSRAHSTSPTLQLTRLLRSHLAAKKELADEQLTDPIIEKMELDPEAETLPPQVEPQKSNKKKLNPDTRKEETKVQDYKPEQEKGQNTVKKTKQQHKKQLHDTNVNKQVPKAINMKTKERKKVKSVKQTLDNNQVKPKSTKEKKSKADKTKNLQKPKQDSKSVSKPINGIPTAHMPPSAINLTAQCPSPPETETTSADDIAEDLKIVRNKKINEKGSRNTTKKSSNVNESSVSTPIDDSQFKDPLFREFELKDQLIEELMQTRPPNSFQDISLLLNDDLFIDSEENSNDVVVPNDEDIERYLRCCSSRTPSEIDVEVTDSTNFFDNITNLTETLRTPLELDALIEDRLNYDYDVEEDDDALSVTTSWDGEDIISTETQEAPTLKDSSNEKEMPQPTVAKAISADAVKTQLSELRSFRIPKQTEKTAALKEETPERERKENKQQESHLNVQEELLDKANNQKKKKKGNKQEHSLLNEGQTVQETDNFQEQDQLNVEKQLPKKECQKLPKVTIPKDDNITNEVKQKVQRIINIQKLTQKHIQQRSIQHSSMKDQAEKPLELIKPKQGQLNLKKSEMPKNECQKLAMETNQQIQHPLNAQIREQQPQQLQKLSVPKLPQIQRCTTVNCMVRNNCDESMLPASFRKPIFPPPYRVPVESPTAALPIVPSINGIYNCKTTIFGIKCWSYLNGSCEKINCNHTLGDIGDVKRRLDPMNKSQLVDAYSFVLRHGLLFQAYFPLFAEIYGSRSMLKHLSQMVQDCGLYIAHCAPFIIDIFWLMLRYKIEPATASAHFMKHLWKPNIGNAYPQLTLQLLMILANSDWYNYDACFNNLFDFQQFPIPHEFLMTIANDAVAKNQTLIIVKVLKLLHFFGDKLDILQSIHEILAKSEYYQQACDQLKQSAVQIKMQQHHMQQQLMHQQQMQPQQLHLQQVQQQPMYPPLLEQQLVQFLLQNQHVHPDILKQEVMQLVLQHKQQQMSQQSLQQQLQEHDMQLQLQQQLPMSQQQQLPMSQQQQLSLSQQQQFLLQQQQQHVYQHPLQQQQQPLQTYAHIEKPHNDSNLMLPL